MTELIIKNTNKNDVKCTLFSIRFNYSDDGFLPFFSTTVHKHLILIFLAVVEKL